MPFASFIRSNMEAQSYDSHVQPKLRTVRMTERGTKWHFSGNQPWLQNQNKGHWRHHSRTNIRGLRIVPFLLFLTVSTLAYHPSAALAQSQPEGPTSLKAKRVLVLCSYGYSLPAYQKLNPAFLAVMEKVGMNSNALFFEYLDLLHMESQEHRQALADTLRHKYKGIEIDLIVTLHAPAMTFLLNEARDIFPNVPILSWNAQEAFKEEDTQRRIIGLSGGIDIRGTLERALQLFPQTRRVLFMAGVSQIDRYIETEAKSVFSGWENKLQFEYTSGNSVEEILERVSKLPPQSIVVYGNIFKDITGRSFIPRDVGEMVAKASNAPVFALYDTLMGRGVVGGSLLSFEADGAWVGRFALDILNGKIKLGKQGAAITGRPVPMFDWRQIKKWDCKVSSLPEESIFINRTLSLWDRYAWYILGFFGVLLGQLLLIGSLVLQRRRRERAEEELKEINETLEQRVAERTAEVQESEARYRSLFSSMTEGFAVHEIITDADGKPCDYRFMDINPAFERLTGISREAVVGKTVREVIPNIEAYWIDTYSQVALEGTPVHFENYSDPLGRWYGVFAYRTAPRQFAAVFADITERKEAEIRLEEASRSLERQKDLLQCIIDSARNCHLVYLDPNFNFVQVNESYARTCGYTPQEMVGKNHFVLYPHEENEAIFARVRDTGVPVEFHDKLFVFPDQPERGTTYWDWILTPVKNAAGAVIGLVLSLFETTQRKHAEEELFRINQRLMALMKALPVGVSFSEDNTCQQISGNPAFLAQFEVMSTDNASASAEDISSVGRQIRYSNDGREISSDELPLQRAVTENREIGPMELEIRLPSGRRWVAAASGAPLRDQLGQVLGGVAVTVDITERKQAEKALRQLNESLEQQVAERTKLAEERAKQLQILLSELVVAEERERQRLAEILHDHLQQLLVGAKINSEILSASIGTEMKQVSENVLNLINQSIQTSRSLTAELSPPTLQKGLTSALEWLSRWILENQAFAVDLQTAPSLDPQREDITILLYHSVRELLFNVVKHAGVKSARLEMARDVQNRLRVSIIDQGAGFDPAAIWKNPRAGTGFGLFSIRERLQLLDGELEIESSPGNGACVSLVVPLEQTRDTGENEKHIRKVIAKRQRSKTLGEKIRVLLVDDHTVVRQGLSRMLELHNDIQVVDEAADGEEAIEKVRTLQPDVILMDISMPRMDGIEATRIISSEFPHIRIIGLSMHDKQDQAKRMIEAGASTYCAKDGDTSVLLSAILGGGTK
jgi:PAS domain S-box-containing protein